MTEVLEGWSPREVLALVEGLPTDGLFAAHAVGGEKWAEHVGWGKDRHMLADIWDLTVAVNTPKGKKAALYPRPDSKKPQQGTPLMSMIPRFNTTKGD